MNKLDFFSVFHFFFHFCLFNFLLFFLNWIVLQIPWCQCTTIKRSLYTKCNFIGSNWVFFSLTFIKFAIKRKFLHDELLLILMIVFSFYCCCYCCCGVVLLWINALLGIHVLFEFDILKMLKFSFSGKMIIEMIYRALDF